MNTQIRVPGLLEVDPYSTQLKNPWIELFMRSFLVLKDLSFNQMKQPNTLPFLTSNIGNYMCFNLICQLAILPTCLTVSMHTCTIIYDTNFLALILLICDSCYLPCIYHMIKPRQTDKCVVFPASWKLAVNAKSLTV